METVKPDAEFRLYRRLPRTIIGTTEVHIRELNALAILNAMDSAKPWDHISHAAVIGPYHAYTPGYTLTLAWCKDMKDDAQREKGSVAICYGNGCSVMDTKTTGFRRKATRYLTACFPNTNRVKNRRVADNRERAKARIFRLSPPRTDSVSDKLGMAVALVEPALRISALTDEGTNTTEPSATPAMKQSCLSPTKPSMGFCGLNSKSSGRVHSTALASEPRQS